MMESIRKQTYKNIITIVHSDDPRDDYVTGDIVINGTAFGTEYGNGTYNLYNNKLMKAIPPGEGWFHFIDDDDEYASDTVIETLVEKSKSDHINVARVERWNKTVWPKNWGKQQSFQTECFFLNTAHKFRGKWWGNKGGDHNYSRQITKLLPINWIDNLLICKAQEGKGHGRKLDKGGKPVDYSNKLNPEQKIPVLGLYKYRTGIREERIAQGQIKWMKYSSALKLEEEGIVKITNWANKQHSAPAIHIFQN